MSKPKKLLEVMLDMASNPNDPFGKVLRQCPSIQAELIRRKKISLDDLTDRQIDRLIEWDQKHGGEAR